MLTRRESIHRRNFLSSEPDCYHLHWLGTTSGTPPAAPLELLDVIASLGLVGPLLDLLIRDLLICHHTSVLRK